MIMDYHADYSNSGKNWVSCRILHGVIRKWFLDRARPHLARIFPVVPASAKFLHELYKVPHSEMELLPLGADVDLAREIRTRQEGKQLRESLSIPDEAIVVFTGGKLAPHKRTELLIEAVARLPQHKLHVVVAGEASEADQVYKRAANRSSKGRECALRRVARQTVNLSTSGYGRPSSFSGQPIYPLAASHRCGPATDRWERGGSGHILPESSW